MAVSFVFWYTDQQINAPTSATIYFKEPVSGLTAGTRCAISESTSARWCASCRPQAAQPREVLADTDAGAPIDGRTQASLNLQRRHRFLYIDLEQDRKAAAPGAAGAGFTVSGHPIRSVGFRGAVEQLPALATHAIEFGRSCQSSVPATKCAAIRTTLDNTRLASGAPFLPPCEIQAWSRTCGGGRMTCRRPPTT